MNSYYFTENVRRALAMAREEAVRLHHEYVGTEHILLALIRLDQGGAVDILRNLDVDLVLLRQEIEEVVKEGAPGLTGPDLPYTSRAKRVLEEAMQAARELNASAVGTQHLLLGLLREQKGIAAQVLNATGVTLESARQQVIHLQAESPAAEPNSAGPPWGTQILYRGGGRPIYPPHADMPSEFAAQYWLVGPGPFSNRVANILRQLLPQQASAPVRLTPEALLLKVLEAGGIATAALIALGVDVPTLVEAVAQLPDAHPSADVPPVKKGPDQPMARVFWRAAALAAQDGGPRRTDHLLLAILDEPHGSASRTLETHGVTQARLREVLQRIAE